MILIKRKWIWKNKLKMVEWFWTSEMNLKNENEFKKCHWIMKIILKTCIEFEQWK
jgi:hypothetical protein